jgi:hypothetical protein
MQKPITSYAALQKVIENLGPPAPGMRRVFRGQTANYTKMLPTGMRHGVVPWDAIWRHCSIVLARDLAGLSPEEDSSPELSVYSIWVQALAQHYGPGSTFLDVTASPDVALWFALHAATDEEVLEAPKSANRLEIALDYPVADDKARQLIQNLLLVEKDDRVDNVPGALVIRKPIPMVELRTRYRRHEQGPGWFYVFDVPEWDGTLELHRGELIDLAHAPGTLALSKRMQVQSACLLRADPAAKQDNLWDLLRVGTPFPVSWPIEDAPSVNQTTEEMFPDPSADPWYQRFLALPLVLGRHPDVQTPFRWVRPLPVTVYLSDRPAGAMSTLDCATLLDPPIALPMLAGSQPPTARCISAWMYRGSSAPPALQVRDATPILLQGPLLQAVPTADGQAWNHGVLYADMADSVENLAFTETPVSNPVSLTNVLFEFSPLERAGWERIGQPGGEMKLLRALWLLRNETRFAVQLFYQLLPIHDAKNGFESFSVEGPFRYEFISEIGRFHMQAEDGMAVEVTGRYAADKPFFLALALLRALSPNAKAEPWFVSETQSEDGTWQYVFPVRDTAALLEELSIYSIGRVYQMKDALLQSLLQNMVSNEPFFFGPSTILGHVQAESTVPWPRIAASWFNSRIKKKWPGR